MGDHKTGREAAEAGIILARRVNDTTTMGRLLSLVSLACIFLGDFAAVEKSLTEAEMIARQTGLAEQPATVLTTRAQLAFSGYGDLVQAKAYLDEAVSLSATLQNEWATAMSLFGMGRVAGGMGDLATACTKFRQSADLAKKMGNKRQMNSCYSELAHILRENSELDEPLAIYRDLLPKWRDIGHRAAVAHELECIVYILIKKDELQRAATILGGVDALRKMIDSVPTPLELVEYDREVSVLREKMGSLAFQISWDEGQRLSMDEAIALTSQEEYRLSM